MWHLYVDGLAKQRSFLALMADHGVLGLLDIDAEIPLNIRTDGKCLVVPPDQDTARQKQFRGAAEGCNRQLWKSAEEAG